MNYKIASCLILASSIILLGVIIAHSLMTNNVEHKIPDARKSAKEHVETGKLLVTQKFYGDAVKEFKKSIELDKTYIPAYEWLGEAYFMQNMFEDALKTFQSAVAVSPNNGSLHYNIGVILGRKGLYKEAVKEYKRAIELGVEHAGIYHNLGISYGQVGRHEDAVKSYKKGIELDPNNSNLHYDLGVEYEAVNDNGLALKEYGIAIRLNPNNTRALFRFGVVCYGMYKYTEAIKHLRKVIDLDPTYRGARRVLGQCYMRLNEMEKSKRMLFAEIARFPDEIYSHFLLGEIYSTQEKTDAAVKEFRKAVAMNKDAYTYHYRLGQELFKLGKVDEARKEIKISEELRNRAKTSMTDKESAQGIAKNGIEPIEKLLGSVRKSSTKIGSEKKERYQRNRGIFLDVTNSAKIRFKHTNGATGKKYIIETFGSGCGFLDYDNDGNMDIYLMNSSYHSDSTHVATAIDPIVPSHNSPSDETAISKSKSEKRGTQNSPRPTNTLYRNEGDGTFTDVTFSAGVGDPRYGMGCTFGDYDNDGDTDIYTTNFGPSVLYRNNGDGTFTDVTDIAGVSNAPDGIQRWSTSCAFADYDNDGYLDLYVVNYLDYSIERNKECRSAHALEYCHPKEYDGMFDTLYRNNGDGTFTDVSKIAGILPRAVEQGNSHTAIPKGEEPGKGLGVVWGDYDNDGDLDIYVANDTTRNLLYSNNGDGTFTEIGLLAGVGYNSEGEAEAGMGTDFGDYDNDGRLDIFVTNFDGETNTLYHNEGGMMFSDASLASGVGGPSIRYLCFGTGFNDYDNDGFSDIFVATGHIQDNVTLETHGTTYAQASLLFKNNGDGTFTDMSKRAGEALSVKTVSRGSALGDYDNDGDLDILISNNNSEAMLLQNRIGNKNNYLVFKAIGTRSNRDGVGARIKVVCHHSASNKKNVITQIKEVKSASSYQSQNDPRVFFGLGQSQDAEFVEIRWPSGAVENFRNVKANQFLVIREK